MSYLATLARPGEATPRVTAPQAPAPAVEPFVEVHREVEAAPVRAALPEPASTVDRPAQSAPSMPRASHASVERPVAIVEASARPPVLRHALPVVEERGPAAVPVAELLVVSAAAQHAESAIEALSSHEASSLPPRGAGETSHVVRRAAGDANPALSTPAVPISREPGRTLRRDGNRDQAAHEATHWAEHAPTRLPVVPVERSDKAATRPMAYTLPGRAKVNVHIGAISLTVKAPAVASLPAAPVIAPVAQALPSSAPPRSREGFGFSASRHYLRWS